jgi:hypothetical protein
MPYIFFPGYPMKLSPNLLVGLQPDFGRQGDQGAMALLKQLLLVASPCQRLSG